MTDLVVDMVNIRASVVVFARIYGFDIKTLLTISPEKCWMVRITMV